MAGDVQKKIIVTGDAGGWNRTMQQMQGGLDKFGKAADSTVKTVGAAFSDTGRMAGKFAEGLGVPIKGMTENAGLARRALTGNYKNDEQRQADRERMRQIRDETAANAGRTANQLGRTAIAGAGVDVDFSSAGGFMNSIVQKFFSAANAFDHARSAIDGLTRSASGATVGLSRANFGAAAKFGMNQSEFLSYQKSRALAYGGAGQLAERSLNQFGVERAYGLSEGTLNQFGGATRQGAGGETGYATGTAITAQVIQAFKKMFKTATGGTDYTQLNEKLSQTATLLNESSREQQDLTGATKRITGLLSGFTQLGGSFAGANALAPVNAINQGIKSPSNQFTQAYLFRQIQSVMPNAGLWEVQKAQEQGLTGKFGVDVFKKMLEGQKGVSRETRLLNLKQLFSGLTHEEVESLESNFMSGKMDWKKMIGANGKVDVTKFGEFAGKTATGLTGGAAQNAAIVEDLALANGYEYVTKFSGAVTKALGGDATGALADLGGLVWDGLAKGLLNRIKKGLTPDFGLSEGKEAEDKWKNTKEGKIYVEEQKAMMDAENDARMKSMGGWTKSELANTSINERIAIYLEKNLEIQKKQLETMQDKSTSNKVVGAKK